MATSAVDVISFNAANSGDAAAGADVINHSAAMVSACDASSSTLAAGKSSPVLFGCDSTAFDAMTLAAGKSSPVLFGCDSTAFDAMTLAAGHTSPVLFDAERLQLDLKDSNSPDAGHSVRSATVDHASPVHFEETA
eukprot:4335431-Karenia_brevis.AAC.1